MPDHHHPSTAAPGNNPPVAAPATSQSALVAFLTTADPMIAGHAVHFTRHMLDSGRRATLLLIGEAGR